MTRSNVPTPATAVHAPLRLIAAIATAAFLLGACGGSSDQNENADTGNGTTAEQPSDTPAGSDTGDQEGSGAGNYAIVTVGGTSYEVPADPLNLCNSLDNLIFGSFATNAGGQATQAGGEGVATQINFGVPATDWQAQGLQAPTVNLDLIEDGVRWFASSERGVGAVDSWQLADGKATGEATFVAEAMGSGEEIGTETGSFEVVCQ